MRFVVLHHRMLETVQRLRLELHLYSFQRLQIFSKYFLNFILYLILISNFNQQNDKFKTLSNVTRVYELHQHCIQLPTSNSEVASFLCTISTQSNRKGRYLELETRSKFKQIQPTATALACTPVWHSIGEWFDMWNKNAVCHTAVTAEIAFHTVWLVHTRGWRSCRCNGDVLVRTATSVSLRRRWNFPGKNIYIQGFLSIWVDLSSTGTNCVFVVSWKFSKLPSSYTGHRCSCLHWNQFIRQIEQERSTQCTNQTLMTTEIEHSSSREQCSSSWPSRPGAPNLHTKLIHQRTEANRFKECNKISIKVVVTW